MKLLLLSFSSLENEWMANESILSQAYVSKGRASHEKTTFNAWSCFYWAFQALRMYEWQMNRFWAKRMKQFQALKVVFSWLALLFDTYAWLKIDSFAIHTFSRLEKLSRSNFRHWKTFFIASDMLFEAWEWINGKWIDFEPSVCIKK